MLASASAVHGPWARRPASTVRKPDIPGALRSVGNQPEPKLIALSVRLNAARSSSVAPSRSGAGGDSEASVAAYRSIPSSTIRTYLARPATRAAAARMRSTIVAADHEHRSLRVVEEAGRDAAEDRGGE